MLTSCSVCESPTATGYIQDAGGCGTLNPTTLLVRGAPAMLALVITGDTPGGADHSELAGVWGLVSPTIDVRQAFAGMSRSASA